MSIQTELTRITNAKAAIKAAIEGKGVTVPDGTLLDGMAALIESIEAGGGGGGFVTGTFTLAKDIGHYVIAKVEHVPDFVLVYRIDSAAPGDYVFTVIASTRVGNEVYQAAYRNTSTPKAFKGVGTIQADGSYSPELVWVSKNYELNNFEIELYMESYYMIAGTYGYIFGNFE